MIFKFLCSQSFLHIFPLYLKLSFFLLYECLYRDGFNIFFCSTFHICVLVMILFNISSADLSSIFFTYSLICLSLPLKCMCLPRRFSLISSAPFHFLSSVWFPRSSSFVLHSILISPVRPQSWSFFISLFISQPSSSVLSPPSHLPFLLSISLVFVFTKMLLNYYSFYLSFFPIFIYTKMLSIYHPAYLSPFPVFVFTSTLDHFLWHKLRRNRYRSYQSGFFGSSLPPRCVRVVKG